ncbi:MAG: HisA/HisF-related TIM barrel protein [Alphaproteobacteria bacterium]|nr:HisA/HisF-related TIM barrel protein [Alphaproteobacteria bacterium]
MSVQRLIPVLLHRNGKLILSRNFGQYQDIGNPYYIAERLKSWDVDELIFLDISRYWSDTDSEIIFDKLICTIQEISCYCFIPLAVGGGIRNTNHMRRLIAAGADRIVLNSAALENPSLITAGAELLGTQAIIIGIDAYWNQVEKTYQVKMNGGRKRADWSAINWACEAEKRGAGEIFIQSIDRDGSGEGYDLSLIREITTAVKIPIVACGGAGTWHDFSKPLMAGAKASAAANIFNFQELSYKACKDAVSSVNIPIRPSTLGIDYAAAKRTQLKKSQFQAEDFTIWQDLAKTGFME